MTEPHYVIDMDEADEAAEKALTAADIAFVAQQVTHVSRETQVAIIWGSPKAVSEAMAAATREDRDAVAAICSPPRRDLGQSWRQAIRMLVRKLTNEKKVRFQAAREAFLARQAS